MGSVYGMLAQPEIALTYLTRSLESMEKSKEKNSFSDLIREGKLVKTNNKDTSLKRTNLRLMHVFGSAVKYFKTNQTLQMPFHNGSIVLSSIARPRTFSRYLTKVFI